MQKKTHRCKELLESNFLSDFFLNSKSDTAAVEMKIS